MSESGARDFVAPLHRVLRVAFRERTVPSKVAASRLNVLQDLEKREKWSESITCGQDSGLQVRSTHKSWTTCRDLFIYLFISTVATV